jgi:hypothetical protein
MKKSASRFDMKSSHKIFLTQGRQNGTCTWHYVKIDALKQPLLKKAVKSGSVDVADYGEVICSGWGKNPPESVVEMIQKKYG